jgi:hypothetical protein
VRRAALDLAIGVLLITPWVGGRPMPDKRAWAGRCCELRQSARALETFGAVTLMVATLKLVLHAEACRFSCQLLYTLD